MLKKCIMYFRYLSLTMNVVIEGINSPPRSFGCLIILAARKRVPWISDLAVQYGPNWRPMIFESRFCRWPWEGPFPEKILRASCLVFSYLACFWELFALNLLIFGSLSFILVYSIFISGKFLFLCKNCILDNLVRNPFSYMKNLIMKWCQYNFQEYIRVTE